MSGLIRGRKTFILFRSLAQTVNRSRTNPIELLRTTSVGHRWTSTVTENAGPTAAVEAPETTKFDHSHRQQNQLDKVLYMIDQNVKRTGRVLTVEVQRVRDVMDKLGLCTANHALLLLKCCGSVLVDEKPANRSKMATEIWEAFEEKGVHFDASHFNALLKVHLENEHEFSPTEFLSWMEGKGIEPNRVTFQHLIAKYCQNGDIAGATTILEFMKQQDMVVNEHVFHSLITGHCRANDFESAKSVMTIMSDAGLDITSETHITYILGMVRSKNKSWDEVKTVIKECQEQDVQFHDHDIFQLVIELIKSEQIEGAREAVAMLPRRSGYFQEMRNSIPQMIFAGDPEIAFDILSQFKAPQLGAEHHSDSSTRDNGLFILRAMVKNEYPPEKFVELLKKMSDLNPVCVSRTLEICLEQRKGEYGSSIAQLAKAEIGSKCFKGTDIVPFLRSHFSRLNNEEEIIDALVLLDKIGIRPPPSTLSNDVFSKLLPPNSEPGPIISKIARKLPNRIIGYANLGNAAVQCLLNRENPDDFKQALGFVMNVNLQLRPLIWNASLARSYLATKDLDSLVSFLFVASLKENNYEKEYQDNLNLNFRTLAHVHSLAPRYIPESTGDDVLKPILEELTKCHIGMPDETANFLKATVTDEAAKALLEQLADIHKVDDYWTKEKIEEFVTQRNSLNRRTGNASMSARDQSGFVRIRGKGFIEGEDIPTTIADMERVQGVVEKRGGFSTLLTTKLIEAYAKEGEVDKGISLLEKSTAENDYTANLAVSKEIIENLVKLGRLEEAIEFMSKQKRVFCSTFFPILVALAESGQHDRVIEIIKNTPQSSVVGDMRTLDANDTILKHYVEAKDVEGVERVLEALSARGLLDNKRAFHLNALIQVHMERDDYETAVSTFERICKEKKLMPYKNFLMEKLIEMEDMERMQRVVDASIDLIGEERSLYDLAWNFLILGKATQARKLLETPGLRYNQDKVNYICNYFLEKKNLEALENFVYMTKNVFACDREFMYNKLVYAFSDNVQKIKEVWVNMQEEEKFVPSDNLKIKMAKVFEAAGEPIPFEVPETYVKPEPKPKAEKKEKTEKKEVKEEKAEKRPKKKEMKTSVTPLSKTALDQAVEQGDDEEILRIYKNFPASGIPGHEAALVYLIEKSSDLAYPATLAAIKNSQLALFKKRPEETRKMLDNLNFEQFAELRSNIRSLEVNRRYLLDRRYATALAMKDFDAYLKQFKSVSDRPQIADFNAFKKALADKAQAEKAASVAVETSVYGLGQQVFQHCIVNGFNDVAADVWEKCLKEKLPRLKADAVQNFSDEEIEKLLSEFKANDDYECNVRVCHVAKIGKSISAGDLVAAKARFDEAIAGSVPLTEMSNVILRELPNMDGVTQELKDQAIQVLDTRVKERRPKQKKKQKKEDTSSSSSSSSDDEPKKN